MDDAKMYYESIDMDDAFHAKTIPAYQLNDESLPVSPLALRCAGV